MTKFDKEYYRNYRFYANKGYNIHNILRHEYEEDMVNYNKNFFQKCPKEKMERLQVFEEELARVNAYKAALEEGIELFKEHYL